MFNPVSTDDTLFIVEHKENCVNGAFLAARASDVACSPPHPPPPPPRIILVA